MPELPEVETIKESLQGIVGLTIENIDIIRPRLHTPVGEPAS